MTDLKVASEKFFPLFEENRLPVLINGKTAKYDVFTRKIVGDDGKPIPSIYVKDPGHFRTRYYVYFGGRGGAKCLGRGTKVVMFDGTRKAVEEVQVGEKLLGMDGTARTVLSTTQGVGDLYLVRQLTGEDYVVNADHILALQDENYSHFLIRAQDYLGRSDGYSRNNVMGRTRIDVTPIGPGEFFGFELDGDHLFFLNDFTVTHNSHQFASAAIIRAMRRKTKFLCCREIMSTMADSVMSLLKIKIESAGLGAQFDILTNEIRCKATGSSFSFRGLRHNINELKSFEDADVCWVEEAADVSEVSWDKLDPTIRKPGSEIWVGFNTELETDPTYERFVTNKDEDMTVLKVGYEDNPLIDAAMIKQALKMKKANPTKYAHIWGGEPRRTKEGGIFTPEMITIVDVIPAGTRFVRGWDLAGTAIDPKKPNKDPDWTRGVLLGMTPSGRVIIADMASVRGKPEIVESLMLITMKNDGWAVEQSIPQDPGQAGKFQVSYFAKEFGGHRLHFSPETGSKAVRAGPFASQVNAGNVDMIRASWNRDVIDEMKAFSGEECETHDDIIDSGARAYSRLLTPRAHQRVAISGL